MTPLDVFWLWLIPFSAGLIVFQTGGKSKHTLGTISSVIFIISFFQIQPSPISIVEYIGISKLGGILTTLSYLIGANISRGKRFGEISLWRIIVYVYIVLLFTIWIVH